MTRTNLFLGLILVSFLVTDTAWSQFTTAVAPARVEQLVNPGSKVEDVITFTNQGDTPVKVSISIVDFDVDEMGTVTELPPGMHPTTIAPYFRISPLRTTVGAKEQAHFRFSVDTPEAFEQLRAFVYFESEPLVEEGGGKQIVFATAMGIPLYVENRKADRGTLTVHDVSWERTGDERQYVQMKVHVTNEGARNIRPGGFLTVQSADDRFLETFDVNTGGDVVLPGHERHLTMQFGPIPDDALSLKLRFETSARSNYQDEYHMPKAVPAEEGGR